MRAGRRLDQDGARSVTADWPGGPRSGPSTAFVHYISPPYDRPVTSTPPAADESLPATSMPADSRLHLAVWIFGAAGIVLALALVIRSGASEIADLLRTASWSLLWLLPIHGGVMTFTGAAARSLLPRPTNIGLPYLTGVSLVREAVGGLLPTLHVGSEVSGIRLLMRKGVSGTTACAIIVVELTLWMTAQLIFALIGLVLLLGFRQAGPIPRYAALGLLAVAATIVAFVLVQRRVGLFGLVERLITRVAGRNVLRFTGGTASIDEAIRELYRNHRALTSCVLCQLGHFMAGAVETWVTLWLLHRPIGLRSAVVLESLSVVIQTATFFVPAGVGTQEASLVLVGAAVGVPAATALALAIARRARQLALGIPAIAIWFWSERRLG
jgi:putative membrane protein